MFYHHDQFEEIAGQAREAFGNGRASVLHARDGLRLLVEAGGALSIVTDKDR